MLRAWFPRLVTILILVATVPATAALPSEDAQALQLIDGYLNGITTLAARFEQINPDGGKATGKLYIQRPGKMRFDYDPPSKVLLVATDWRLIFWDGSINQENVIPISKTPLGYLLGDKVQLGDAYEVTHVDQRPAETDVTVIGKGAPDQGSVTLTFSTSRCSCGAGRSSTRKGSRPGHPVRSEDRPAPRSRAVPLARAQYHGSPQELSPASGYLLNLPSG